MAEAITSPVRGRCAIVTGANKGIGFETCKQLAAKGIMVVLTARDEKRGCEALERLKDLGLSHHVVFHQLDVLDPTSIASLADFIKTRFGKLDILINNAGFLGVGGDASAISEKIMGNASRVKSVGDNEEEIQAEANATYIENYELAEQCLQINYYGAKRMIEAFIPLLQLSDSPRIVNVSSFWGMLKYVSNAWATDVLSDAESLTEERVDEVVNEFLKDFKQGSLEAKGWPPSFPAYIVSKAALNAYTRIVAKKYPNLCINCVCPGRVKTDMSCYTGLLTVEEGAKGPVKVALLPEGGPSGVFFVHQEVSSF